MDPTSSSSKFSQYSYKRKYEELDEKESKQFSGKLSRLDLKQNWDFSFKQNENFSTAKNMGSMQHPIYQGLHVHPEISNEQLLSLTKRIDSMDVKEILAKITHRIGSESDKATVWKLPIDNNFIAVKILQPGSQQFTGIEVSKELRDQYSKNFLRMITNKSATCVIDEKEIPSELLFMEIALGNMDQVLEASCVTIQDLEKYVCDVFDSISILAKKGIIHSNLHLRNVFVIRTEDTNKAVLGDFCKIESAAVQVSSHLIDVKTFIKSLEQKLMVLIEKTSYSEDGLSSEFYTFFQKIKQFQTILDKEESRVRSRYWSSLEAEYLILRLKAAWQIVPRESC